MKRRKKADPAKVQMARRLWKETTMSWRWIPAGLVMGAADYAAAWKLPRAGPQSLPVLVAIAPELEEELAIMTTMRQVVELPRNEIAIGPWHAANFG